MSASNSAPMGAGNWEPTFSNRETVSVPGYNENFAVVRKEETVFVFNHNALAVCRKAATILKEHLDALSADDPELQRKIRLIEEWINAVDTGVLGLIVSTDTLRRRAR